MVYEKPPNPRQLVKHRLLCSVLMRDDYARSNDYMSHINRPNAKLTPEQVLEIRAAPGRQDKIAALYGITNKTVSAIKRKRIWRELE